MSATKFIAILKGCVEICLWIKLWHRQTDGLSTIQQSYIKAEICAMVFNKYWLIEWFWETPYILVMSCSTLPHASLNSRHASGACEVTLQIQMVALYFFLENRNTIGGSSKVKTYVQNEENTKWKVVMSFHLAVGRGWRDKGQELGGDSLRNCRRYPTPLTP